MTHKSDISILRRYSAFAWMASLLVTAFGALAMVLFAQPTLIGVEPSSSYIYEGNLAWLVFGMVLVALGIVFQITVYRWPRRLLRVLRTELSKQMRLQVEVEESSDFTQYYALVLDDSMQFELMGWRVDLWAPSGQTRKLVGKELIAKVYFDPKTSNPSVIEYNDGYLWAMKGATTPLQMIT